MLQEVYEIIDITDAALSDDTLEVEDLQEELREIHRLAKVVEHVLHFEQRHQMV